MPRPCYDGCRQYFDLYEKIIVYEYRENGLLHNTEGPAYLNYSWPSGIEEYAEYRIEGFLHRSDGPAREWYQEKRHEWYLHGVRLDENVHTMLVKLDEIQKFYELAKISKCYQRFAELIRPKDPQLANFILAGAALL